MFFTSLSETHSWTKTSHIDLELLLTHELDMNGLGTISTFSAPADTDLLNHALFSFLYTKIIITLP